MHQIEIDFKSIEANRIFADISPEIVAAFWKYHALNPIVWQLFQKYSFELLAAGRKRYSIAAITERIRWHINIETAGDEFKFNNNYKSCYARLLIETYPQFRGFFETRSSPGTVKLN